MSAIHVVKSSTGSSGKPSALFPTFWAPALATVNRSRGTSAKHWDFREPGYECCERGSIVGADAAVDKVSKVKEAVFKLEAF